MGFLSDFNNIQSGNRSNQNGNSTQAGASFLSSWNSLEQERKRREEEERQRQEQLKQQEERIRLQKQQRYTKDTNQAPNVFQKGGTTYKSPYNADTATALPTEETQYQRVLNQEQQKAATQNQSSQGVYKRKAAQSTKPQIIKDQPSLELIKKAERNQQLDQEIKNGESKKLEIEIPIFKKLDDVISSFLGVETVEKLNYNKLSDQQKQDLILKLKAQQQLTDADLLDIEYLELLNKQDTVNPQSTVKQVVQGLVSSMSYMLEQNLLGGKGKGLLLQGALQFADNLSIPFADAYSFDENGRITVDNEKIDEMTKAGGYNGAVATVLKEAGAQAAMQVIEGYLGKIAGPIKKIPLVKKGLTAIDNFATIETIKRFVGEVAVTPIAQTINKAKLTSNMGGFAEELTEEVVQYFVEPLIREGKVNLPTAQEAAVTVLTVGALQGILGLPANLSVLNRENSLNTIKQDFISDLKKITDNKVPDDVIESYFDDFVVNEVENAKSEPGMQLSDTPTPQAQTSEQEQLSQTFGDLDERGQPIQLQPPPTQTVESALPLNNLDNKIPDEARYEQISDALAMGEITFDQANKIIIDEDLDYDLLLKNKELVELLNQKANESGMPDSFDEESDTDQYETPTYQRDADTAFFTSLTPEEQEAIIDYSAAGYKTLNQSLIADETARLSTKDKIINDNLIKSIDRYEIQEPMTVYRGLGKDEAEIFRDKSVGDEFSINGFYSTSTDKNTAKRYSKRSGTILQLEVPTGLGIGMDIGKSGSIFGEKEAEVLLKYGNSIIITEKTTTEVDGKKVEIIKGELNVRNRIASENEYAGSEVLRESKSRDSGKSNTAAKRKGGVSIKKASNSKTETSASKSPTLNQTLKAIISEYGSDFADFIDGELQTLQGEYLLAQDQSNQNIKDFLKSDEVKWIRRQMSYNDDVSGAELSKKYKATTGKNLRLDKLRERLTAILAGGGDNHIGGIDYKVGDLDEDGILYTIKNLEPTTMSAIEQQTLAAIGKINQDGTLSKSITPNQEKILSEMFKSYLDEKTGTIVRATDKLSQVMNEEFRVAQRRDVGKLINKYKDNETMQLEGIKALLSGDYPQGVEPGEIIAALQETVKDPAMLSDLVDGINATYARARESGREISSLVEVDFMDPSSVIAQVARAQLESITGLSGTKLAAEVRKGTTQVESLIKEEINETEVNEFLSAIERMRC